MNVIQWFCSLRRQVMRLRLTHYYKWGRWAAHLPAFLDRDCRGDVHRAYQKAHLRGFLREQQLLREQRLLRDAT